MYVLDSINAIAPSLGSASSQHTETMRDDCVCTMTSNATFIDMQNKIPSLALPLIFLFVLTVHFYVVHPISKQFQVLMSRKSLHKPGILAHLLDLHFFTIRRLPAQTLAVVLTQTKRPLIQRAYMHVYTSLPASSSISIVSY